MSLLVFLYVPLKRGNVLTAFEVFRDRLVKLWFKSQGRN